MNKQITGRCYCGAIEFASTQPPQTVVYCHCEDCKRVTGAPVAAFAAFDDSAVTLKPSSGKVVSVNKGVTRTFCDDCGTPLTGRYEYLPGNVYIPLGVIYQAENLVPSIHCHEAKRFHWLNIEDNCKRWPGSARNDLNAV